MVAEDWSYANRREGCKAIYHAPFWVHSLRESPIPYPIAPFATLIFAAHGCVSI